MKHYSPYQSIDRRIIIRFPYTAVATFVTASLLFAIAVLLFAAPVSAEEPATDAAAVSQPAEPSLQPPIDELRERIGKPAEVTFTVMSVGGRSNLYLNSMKEWRSTDAFTAMLVPAAREELKKLGTDEPFDDLIGRRVRCRGELETDRDRVRIVVTDFAKQFEVLGPEGGSEDAAMPAVASTGAASATAKTSSPDTMAAASSSAAAAPPSSPDTPYVHPSIEELKASVGKECDVTFRVMNAGGRSHLYINSQQNYRRPDCFTAQVDPSALGGLATLGLDNPRTELIGKLLKCHGTVQLENDRPSIVVTDVEKQLQIVEKPGEESAADSQPMEQPQETP